MLERSRGPRFVEVFERVAVSAVAAGFGLGLLAVLGCSKLTEPVKEEPMLQAEPEAKAAPAASASASASAKPAETAPPAEANPNEKLEMKDLVVGKGAEAKSGDIVRVHYVGTLTDGKEFDASRKHDDKGFEFPLGGGRVIKGWDQGVVGMKVGGKRKLTIPPSLGYGARGAPPVIPPNATLVFEVELLEVKSGGAAAPGAPGGAASAKPAASAKQPAKK